MDAADAGSVIGALQAARTQFLNAEVEGNPAPPLAPVDPWPEATPFEMALLAGSQREALAVVNRCIDSGHSLVDIELHVIQPSLYHIGEEWQTNRVSVAKEHMATALALSIMTVGLLRSPPPAAIDRRVLLACVAGNHHSRRSSHGGGCISTRRLGCAVSRCGCTHRGDHPTGRRVDSRIW